MYGYPPTPYGAPSSQPPLGQYGASTQTPYVPSYANLGAGGGMTAANVASGSMGRPTHTAANVAMGLPPPTTHNPYASPAFGNTGGYGAPPQPSFPSPAMQPVPQGYGSPHQPYQATGYPSPSPYAQPQGYGAPHGQYPPQQGAMNQQVQYGTNAFVGAFITITKLLLTSEVAKPIRANVPRSKRAS